MKQLHLFSPFFSNIIKHFTTNNNRINKLPPTAGVQCTTRFWSNYTINHIYVNSFLFVFIWFYLYLFYLFVQISNIILFFLIFSIRQIKTNKKSQDIPDKTRTSGIPWNEFPFLFIHRFLRKIVKPLFYRKSSSLTIFLCNIHTS